MFASFPTRICGEKDMQTEVLRRSGMYTNYRIHPNSKLGASEFELAMPNPTYLNILWIMQLYNLIVICHKVHTY